MWKNTGKCIGSTEYTRVTFAKWSSADRYKEPATLKEARSFCRLGIKPTGLQTQANLADIPSNQTTVQYCTVVLAKVTLVYSVLSTTGAAGPSCTRFISRLASLLADHNSSTSYSCLMSWIRCRLSFALIRSAILCIRGSRSSRHRPVHHEHELAVAESRLQE